MAKAANPLTGNWQSYAESQFSWEREALEFIRNQLPAYAPWFAWSNLEFTDGNGNIREVDLLVFSKQGVFLIEIKSWRGTITGDDSYWTREYDGRRITVDNPRRLANIKSKSLKSILGSNRAFRGGKAQCPFIEPLVFLGDERVRFDITGPGRSGVCLRDRDDRPGIMAALQKRDCPGLDTRISPNLDKSHLQAFAQAMEQAGIRPSLRSRTLADYRLVKPIAEGPEWQDWQGEHVSLVGNKRRIRFYLVRDAKGREKRDLLERAARREFQLLESLNHPGILRAHAFHQHELGPAILFEYPANALRLDHYLSQYGNSLSETTRLHLIQRITEAVEFAHRKQVVHRALSPQSILVVDPDQPTPSIRILNWQTGSRASSTSGGNTITATSHLGALVDESAMAYLAPEVLEDTEGNQQLDVFSLGALAYLIFSGQAPAQGHSDLKHRLQSDQCLLITSVLNGASPALVDLIRGSTQGSLVLRVSGVDEFRSGIDQIEEELTTPDNEFKGNPAEAPSQAVLPGGYVIERRLGQGSSAVAYLVKKQGKYLILKLASQPLHNPRLQSEYRIIKQLAGQKGLIQAQGLTQIGDHAALELEPVFADTEKQNIETLAHRLAREGQLHLDLLERFSEDLLEILCNLEGCGVYHRDIKPENIAVGQGAGRFLHLTLFDFSLAETPPRNITAGTRRYLDPMLSLKDRMHYDHGAERYAVAVTLYQMAGGLGSYPVWGDGQTDPTLQPEVHQATINLELFEASMRDGLGEFFAKAFQRNVRLRHHNAQEMRRDWIRCLAGVARGKSPEDSGSIRMEFETTLEPELSPLLDEATFDTPILELGLSGRAVNALDRTNLCNVRDLLSYPVFRLFRLPGVGSKTRREVNQATRALRDRLGNPPTASAVETQSTGKRTKGVALDPDTCGLEPAIDRLLLQVPPNSRETARLFLGLDDPSNPWPLQASIARQKGVTTGRIGQIVVDLRKRWCEEPILDRVTDQVDELLRSEKMGGVMTLDELAEVLVAGRGFSLAPGQAMPMGRALVRAAMEVEETTQTPRFIGRRDDQAVVVACNESLAKLAFKLGEKADALAGEDPLLNPQRAVELLRGVKGDWTGLGTLQDGRLLKLAGLASRNAALSARQELYPKGMAAVRALRLAQGTWLGSRYPTPEQIRERVASRYPFAEKVPDRPLLDEMLIEAGLPLAWDQSANQGLGGYMMPQATLSVSSTGKLDRWATRQPDSEGLRAPEAEGARQFEDRLTRSRRQPHFLVLLVEPRLFPHAREELLKRFDAQIIDLEGIFLDALRHTAKENEVTWSLVLQADTHRNSQDWRNLMELVRHAMPDFESRLLQECKKAAPKGPDQTDRALLLVNPGLLARYGHMNQLDKVAEQAGRRGGFPAVWLLLAGDHALVDGQPVPLINAAQQASIPLEWLENKHRAVGVG